MTVRIRPVAGKNGHQSYVFPLPIAMARSFNVDQAVFEPEFTDDGFLYRFVGHYPRLPSSSGVALPPKWGNKP